MRMEVDTFLCPSKRSKKNGCGHLPTPLINHTESFDREVLGTAVPRSRIWGEESLEHQELQSSTGKRRDYRQARGITLSAGEGTCTIGRRGNSSDRGSLKTNENPENPENPQICAESTQAFAILLTSPRGFLDFLDFYWFPCSFVVLSESQ